ncbi:MAG: RNA methyltransferase PUA domain-containing protein [Owenweeksia sp.]|nr:RNA methyltransferase PUA domain-containing protein [Owenweeksia sp.]
MNLFLAAKLTDGELGEEETHHAYRVLRMQAGDDLLVTLGKGIIYRAEITYISKKKAQVKLGKYSAMIKLLPIIILP